MAKQNKISSTDQPKVIIKTDTKGEIRGQVPTARTPPPPPLKKK
jgi:hypothetical protein